MTIKIVNDSICNLVKIDAVKNVETTANILIAQCKKGQGIFLDVGRTNRSTASLLVKVLYEVGKFPFVSIVKG